MAVVDELLARLRTILGADGASAVFDTEVSDRYTAGASPALILQHVSTVPAIPIDDSIIGQEDHWQVSVRGSNLANVRSVAKVVIDRLHGYQSDGIKLIEFENWPGTISEGSGSTREYHAPVDFIVQS